MPHTISKFIPRLLGISLHFTSVRMNYTPSFTSNKALWDSHPYSPSYSMDRSQMPQMPSDCGGIPCDPHGPIPSTERSPMNRCVPRSDRDKLDGTAGNQQWLKHFTGLNQEKKGFISKKRIELQPFHQQTKRNQRIHQLNHKHQINIE